MGPMGLQCYNLQRDDLDYYRLPLQIPERRRGHGKTGNVPTIKRFKEERAHKLIKCQNGIQGRQLHFALCCSDFCIPKVESVDARCVDARCVDAICIVGSVAG